MKSDIARPLLDFDILSFYPVFSSLLTYPPLRCILTGLHEIILKH